MDARARQKQINIDLAESRAKGFDEGIYAIAKKLKDRGRPLSEIVEDTGLSAEAVEKL
jgi:hypothetical protein